MANVNTNQHGERIQTLGHLKIVQIAANLAVDLLQDVGSFRKIELESIAGGDNLRWHAVVFEHLLVHGVKTFVAENNYHDFGVLEVIYSHIVLKISLKLHSISFIVELNPIWLFDTHFQLTARFGEVVEHVVGLVIESAAVADDPLLMEQRDTVVDGQLAQSLLVAQKYILVHRKNLWSGQDGTLKMNRIVLNSDIPIFHGFLVLELSAHVHNLVHLLHGVASRLG